MGPARRLLRAATGSQSAVFGAPVAQLDRVPGYEPGGREFESLRARQFSLGVFYSPLKLLNCNAKLGVGRPPGRGSWCAGASGMGNVVPRAPRCCPLPLNAAGLRGLVGARTPGT